MNKIISILFVLCILSVSVSAQKGYDDLTREMDRNTKEIVENLNSYDAAFNDVFAFMSAQTTRTMMASVGSVIVCFFIFFFFYVRSRKSFIKKTESLLIQQQNMLMGQIAEQNTTFVTEVQEIVNKSKHIALAPPVTSLDEHIIAALPEAIAAAELEPEPEPEPDSLTKAAIANGMGPDAPVLSPQIMKRYDKSPKHKPEMQDVMPRRKRKKEEAAAAKPVPEPVPEPAPAPVTEIPAQPEPPKEPAPVEKPKKKSLGTMDKTVNVEPMPKPKVMPVGHLAPQKKPNPVFGKIKSIFSRKKKTVLPKQKPPVVIEVESPEVIPDPVKKAKTVKKPEVSKASKKPTKAPVKPPEVKQAKKEKKKAKPPAPASQKPGKVSKFFKFLKSSPNELKAERRGKDASS